MNLRSCKLHNISLFNCTQLRSVKLLWNTVRCLSLSNCSSLEKLTMDQLGNSMIDLMMQCEEVQVPAPNQGLRHLLATFPANLYSGLCHYNFRTLRCLETFKINGLRDDSFRKLHISALDSQVNLEAIGPFNKMDTLKITADKFTTDWLKISRMQNLREIDFRIRSIENCRDNVLSLSQLTRLEVLSLSPYHGNFQGLSMCTSLQELYLEDCAGFHGDLDFSQLTNLKVLSLFGYQGECLHGLSMCTSLELLILSGCPSLKELTVPYECKTLKEVDLNDMMRMSSFPSLPLHTLPELRICNCPSIPVAEILRELSPNVACGESLLYILQNQYLPQQATEIGEYILASHNAQELIAHHEKNFSLNVFLAGSSN